MTEDDKTPATLHGELPIPLAFATIGSLLLLTYDKIPSQIVSTLGFNAVFVGGIMALCGGSWKILVVFIRIVGKWDENKKYWWHIENSIPYGLMIVGIELATLPLLWWLIRGSIGKIFGLF